MVTIGPGKPKFLRTSDRWNRIDGRLDVNSWGRCSDSRWALIQTYQSAFVDKQLPGETLEDARTRVENQMLVSGRYSMIWEMDLAAPDGINHIRQFAVLGEQRLVEWNWFDINLKSPVLKMVARIYNQTIGRIAAHKLKQADKAYFESREHNE